MAVTWNVIEWEFPRQEVNARFDAGTRGGTGYGRVGS